MWWSITLWIVSFNTKLNFLEPCIINQTTNIFSVPTVVINGGWGRGGGGGFALKYIKFMYKINDIYAHNLLCTVFTHNDLLTSVNMVNVTSRSVLCCPHVRHYQYSRQ